MDKRAPVDHEIHPLLTQRYSPLAFSDRSMSLDDLRRLFEAARWAPSCFNEQPWRFLVALREQTEAFERLASCLVPKNREWAEKASALAIGLASTHFARNGKANVHAWHDLGLATAQLTLQASSMGLALHQMGGFSREQVIERAQVPDGFEAATAIAIGYPGDPSTLPDDLQSRDRADRVRKGQDEFVFGDRFGTALA